MPERVTFLAIGSRGDVEPMAILAGALVSLGVPATVVAVDDYAALVRSRGADFRGTGTTMAAMERLGRGWLGELALRTPLAQPVLLHRWLSGLAEPLAGTLSDLVEPGTLVVTGLASRDAALALTEARGCRLVTLLHTAILPTTQRESHLEGRWFLGWRWRDRLVTQWYWETTSGLSRATSSALRKRLGLQPATARQSTAAADRELILLAADPTLVPAASDWPSTCRQTGAIAAGVPADWTPPAQLQAFLAAGPKPVYVGLGSLNDSGGQGWLDLIVAAARLSGRRIVTPALRGAEPAILGDGEVCTVADLPHDALFPLMAGLVHHGGAGTTAAGLRAGVPSTTAPAMFDQYYHARRLATLGVGPRHVPLHRLTAGRLAGLVVALTGGSHTALAAEVGAQVRAVDGLSATLAELVPPPEPDPVG
ncbi:MAG: glycosyltransferase family 1 protein [Propionibacteriaceae bacterium]|nr:glycosyltransferase family 1 protein [Propionibacteriaceae bacterium]